MDTVVELVGSIKESFNRLVNRYVPQIQTIPLEQGMKFEPTWKTVPTHSLTKRVWIEEFASPVLPAGADMLTLSLYQYQSPAPIGTASSNLRKDPITTKTNGLYSS